MADLCEPAAKKARRVYFSEDVLEQVGPAAGAVKGKKTKGKCGMKHNN